MSTTRYNGEKNRGSNHTCSLNSFPVDLAVWSLRDQKRFSSLWTLAHPVNSTFLHDCVFSLQARFEITPILNCICYPPPTTTPEILIEYRISGTKQRSNMPPVFRSAYINMLGAGDFERYRKISLNEPPAVSQRPWLLPRNLTIFYNIFLFWSDGL